MADAKLPDASFFTHASDNSLCTPAQLREIFVTFEKMGHIGFPDFETFAKKYYERNFTVEQKEFLQYCGKVAVLYEQPHSDQSAPHVLFCHGITANFLEYTRRAFDRAPVVKLRSASTKDDGGMPVNMGVIGNKESDEVAFMYYAARYLSNPQDPYYKCFSECLHERIPRLSEKYHSNQRFRESLGTTQLGAYVMAGESVCIPAENEFVRAIVKMFFSGRFWQNQLHPRFLHALQTYDAFATGEKSGNTDDLLAFPAFVREFWTVGVAPYVDKIELIHFRHPERPDDYVLVGMTKAYADEYLSVLTPDTVLRFPDFTRSATSAVIDFKPVVVKDLIADRESTRWERVKFLANPMLVMAAALGIPNTLNALTAVVDLCQKYMTSYAVADFNFNFIHDDFIGVNSDMPPAANSFTRRVLTAINLYKHSLEDEQEDEQEDEDAPNGDNTNNNNNNNPVPVPAVISDDEAEDGRPTKKRAVDPDVSM